MTKKVVQCTLRSKNATLVAWIDDRPDLKVGVWVTLKDSDDPSRRWEVMSKGSDSVEKSSIPRTGAFFDSDI